MTDLSLRNRLLFTIMPLIVLGFMAVSLGAYWYISNVIKDELSRSMLASVGKSAESINSWLQTIMLEPEIVASMPAAKKINMDFAALDQVNINRHIFLREKYPHIFQDIYAANSRGEYHTVLEHDGSYSFFIGDIANRPYFQEIMAGGRSQITPPLISRTTGVPTIFVVSPIVNNGKPVGLIGSGLSLGYIQGVVKGLKAGRSGYGFLLAQDGRYIYHPNEDYILHNSISELEDTTAHELGHKMLSGASGTFRFIEKKVSMVAFYHPIPIAGWSVATAVPTAELFAPATRMIRMLLLIVGLFLVVISVVFFFVTASLTAPLQLLAARAQAIAAGDLTVKKIPISRRDEIGRVAEAFNVMAENLATTMTTLKESEDRYRGIFENAVEGIFQTSLEGKVLNANPACAKMLGLDVDVTLLKRFNAIQHQLYVNPQDRLSLLHRLQQEGEVRDYEVQFFTAKGTIIWVSINASLIKASKDFPAHIEGLISDITAKKRAEQERKDLEQQLVQAQKMESVGRLAGGVAHDFNNMLGAILGYAEMAILQTEQDSPVLRNLQEIKNAAQRSADLTKQLLAFARKQTIEPKILDLNTTVEGMYTILKRLIGEDINLVWQPGIDVLPIKIDPSQIDQILANLCVNARDAIAGVGQIRIETQQVALDVSHPFPFQECPPGDYTLLLVSDTGCGMSKEVIGNLFEPFFTTKAQGKGTGLGLAMVYGIIKQNNGFIKVASDPGQGTTFSIYLPSQRDQEITPAETDEVDQIPTGHETILLVEDEALILEVARLLLEQLGYRILLANLPDEALSLAKTYEGKIDLLMTDVIMPQMNGKELAEHIQTLRPGIKCLFASGYTGDVIDHRGILEDHVHFIQKPFAMQTLAIKIREVLDGSR